MDPISLIALIMGTGWASGINLYATVLTLGIMGVAGVVDLPPGLHMLEHPLVLGAAAVMYSLEFFADKIPGLDTGWDAVHTFIRIPASIVLAYSAAEGMPMEVQFAAMLVAGGMSTASHATKAGTRAIVNTSPEPFSNWSLSLAEDVAVIGGLWTAMHYPLVFIGLMILFIMAMVWLLPKLWRGIRGLYRRVIGFFSDNKEVLLIEDQRKKDG